jgi:hypothetical protein
MHLFFVYISSLPITVLALLPSESDAEFRFPDRHHAHPFTPPAVHP